MLVKGAGCVKVLQGAVRCVDGAFCALRCCEMLSNVKAESVISHMYDILLNCLFAEALACNFNVQRSDDVILYPHTHSHKHTLPLPSISHIRTEPVLGCHSIESGVWEL